MSEPNKDLTPPIPRLQISAEEIEKNINKLAEEFKLDQIDIATMSSDEKKIQYLIENYGYDTYFEGILALAVIDQTSFEKYEYFFSHLLRNKEICKYIFLFYAYCILCNELEENREKTLEEIEKEIARGQYELRDFFINLLSLVYEMKVKNKPDNIIIKQIRRVCGNYEFFPPYVSKKVEENVRKDPEEYLKIFIHFIKLSLLIYLKCKINNVIHFTKYEYERPLQQIALTIARINDFLTYDSNFEISNSFDDYLKNKEKLSTTKISTGLELLDGLFEGGKGYRKQTLTVITGATGVGKSKFVTRLGANALLQNCKVIHIISENDIDEIYEDYYSCFLGRKFNPGRKEDFDDLRKYMEYINNKLEIVTFPPRKFTPSSIRSLLLKHKLKNDNIDVLIVDSINLMRDDEGSINRFERGENIIEGLFHISKDFDVAILATLQFNRQGMRTSRGGTTDEDDVNDIIVGTSEGASLSYAISHYAHHFFTLNQNPKELPRNLMRIYVEKIRRGASNLIIPIYFDKASMELRELTKEEIINEYNGNERLVRMYDKIRQICEENKEYIPLSTEKISNIQESDVARQLEEIKKKNTYHVDEDGNIISYAELERLREKKKNSKNVSKTINNENIKTEYKKGDPVIDETDKPIIAERVLGMSKDEIKKKDPFLYTFLFDREFIKKNLFKIEHFGYDKNDPESIKTVTQTLKDFGYKVEVSKDGDITIVGREVLSTENIVDKIALIMKEYGKDVDKNEIHRYLFGKDYNPENSSPNESKKDDNQKSNNEYTIVSSKTNEDNTKELVIKDKDGNVIYVNGATSEEDAIKNIEEIDEYEKEREELINKGIDPDEEERNVLNKVLSDDLKNFNNQVDPLLNDFKNNIDRDTKNHNNTDVVIGDDIKNKELKEKKEVIDKKQDETNLEENYINNPEGEKERGYVYNFFKDLDNIDQIAFLGVPVVKKNNELSVNHGPLKKIKKYDKTLCKSIGEQLKENCIVAEHYYKPNKLLMYFVPVTPIYLKVENKDDMEFIEKHVKKMSISKALDALEKGNYIPALYLKPSKEYLFRQLKILYNKIQNNPPKKKLVIVYDNYFSYYLPIKEVINMLMDIGFNKLPYNIIICNGYMMKIAGIDNVFYDVFSEIDKIDYLAITTNASTNKRGEAVMGRGIAKQIADMFPKVKRILGKKIKNREYKTDILGEFEVNDNKKINLISFPVKPKFLKIKDENDLNKVLPSYRNKFKVGDTVPSFALKADRETILKSANELYELIKNNGEMTVYLPLPGTGNGCLTEKESLKILKESNLKYAAHNVYIFTREWKMPLSEIFDRKELMSIVKKRLNEIKNENNTKKSDDKYNIQEKNNEGYSIFRDLESFKHIIIFTHGFVNKNKEVKIISGTAKGFQKFEDNIEKILGEHISKNGRIPLKLRSKKFNYSLWIIPSTEQFISSPPEEWILSYARDKIKDRDNVPGFYTKYSIPLIIDNLNNIYEKIKDEDGNIAIVYEYSFDEHFGSIDNFISIILRTKLSEIANRIYIVNHSKLYLMDWIDEKLEQVKRKDSAENNNDNEIKNIDNNVTIINENGVYDLNENDNHNNKTADNSLRDSENIIKEKFEYDYIIDPLDPKYTDKEKIDQNKFRSFLDGNYSVDKILEVSNFDITKAGTLYSIYHWHKQDFSYMLDNLKEYLGLNGNIVIRIKPLIDRDGVEKWAKKEQYKTFISRENGKFTLDDLKNEEFLLNLLGKDYYCLETNEIVKLI